MPHIMLDIETLSTTSNSLVLSIGAVPFDLKSVYKPHGVHLTLNWQEQLDLGREVSESTLRFWLNQSSGARKAVLSGTGSKLKPALTKLSAMIEKHLDRDSGIWGKGPDFDVVIVNSLFKAAKMPTPWKFWQSRDVRTALMYSEAFDTKEPISHISHNALSDAIYQATQVRKFLNFVKNGNSIVKKDEGDDDLIWQIFQI